MLIYIKCYRIINSCTSIAHLIVALNYLHLASDELDIHKMNSLLSLWDDKLDTLKSI